MADVRVTTGGDTRVTTLSDVRVLVEPVGRPVRAVGPSLPFTASLRATPPLAVSPDVTVSLVGQSIAASLGTLAPAFSISITGVSVAASAGTLAPAHVQGLTGQQVTAAAGTLASSMAFSVLGQASTAAQGAVTVQSSGPQYVGRPVRAVGPSLPFRPQLRSAQRASPDLSISLTGLAMSALQGTIGAVTSQILGKDLRNGQMGPALDFTPDLRSRSYTPSPSPDVTVSLLGQAVTAAVGNLSPVLAALLSGQAANTAAGTLAPGTSKTLTGQQLAAVQSTLAPSLTLQLSGQLLTLSQGTVGVQTGSVVTVNLTGQVAGIALGTLVPARTVAVTGVSATVAQGAVVPASAVGLVGVSATFAQGSLSVSNAPALTGQQLATAAGALAAQRALALLGVQATISQGTVIAGNGVIINLTGLAMALEQGLVGVDRSVLLAGEQITVMPGTLSAFNPTPPTPDGRRNPFIAGALASRNPVSFMDSNVGGGTLRVGPGACIIGRFAWADTDGIVGNFQTSRLGFALLDRMYWYGGYWSSGELVLRPGAPIALLLTGDVWVRFDSGCVAGQQVYADKLTGKAVSGYSADGEPTPWYVVRSARPGELAVISTTSRVQ